MMVMCHWSCIADRGEVAHHWWLWFRLLVARSSDEIHRLMCRKTWSTLLIQFSSNSKRKYNSSSFLNDDVICSFLLGLWFMNFLLIWNFDLCFWFEYEMVFKILNSIWNYCLDFDLNMRLDLVFAIWRAYFGVFRALDFNFFSL